MESQQQLLQQVPCQVYDWGQTQGLGRQHEEQVGPCRGPRRLCPDPHMTPADWHGVQDCGAAVWSPAAGIPAGAGDAAASLLHHVHA